MMYRNIKLNNRKCLRSARLAFAASLFVLATSAGFGQSLNGTESGPVSLQNQNYRIGPGDVIDVLVSQSSALTRTGVRVNNHGMVQLAMLEEEVQAACRTERELAEQVKEKYKKFILNPFVTVSVQQFNSSPVALIGAVHSPTRFQLQRSVRLLELIAQANGPTDKAGTSVEIIRNQSLPYCDGSTLMTPEYAADQLLSFNLNDTLKGSELANPVIRSGDIIRVVEAQVSQAYIGGNVKSSIAIDLRRPVTLTQAIAMAGGVTQGAQIQRIMIRRQIDGSVNRAEMIVNLKEINLQKKDDVLLQSNDLIEVPGPKPNFFRDLMKSFLPAIAGLPMRIIP